MAHCGMHGSHSLSGGHTRTATDQPGTHTPRDARARGTPGVFGLAVREMSITTEFAEYETGLCLDVLQFKHMVILIQLV
jgi:hypothetical protein